MGAMPRSLLASKIVNALWLVGLSAGASPAEPDRPAIAIRRAEGPITVDGDLSDPGWRGATKVETWFETNPGDNVPPKVKSVGYLTYDDHFLYAAFEFQDPNPALIRAPYADRDNISSDTDYGGIILDPRHDGKTGLLLLANPRGIQYDAVSDDVSGNEDSSPDFFWDSAGRITKEGWVLEMRVPFSSLRYPKEEVQTWGIMLYRNYPREFRYQIFSTRLPRGTPCFICNESQLTGLSRLPGGGHVVLAPYVSASETYRRQDGMPGSALQGRPVDGEVGFDGKWTPNPGTAIDAAVNPDFSQVESDVAQIAANERFALLYPEKRPFFLEGTELLTTPIPTVYTRTITSPRWGLRTTGKFGGTAFTGLFAEDRGGGSVVLPGPNASGFANQDFSSLVAIGRLRRDIARSFLSFLFTGREVKGGGYNRVFGPDFQWRPNNRDTVTGQWLYSVSQTPVRPELTSQWDGRMLSGHGAEVSWSHSTPSVDWLADQRDFSDGFRADAGFVPQVGYRRSYGEVGYTFRPEGYLRRLRPSVTGERSSDRAGALLFQEVSFGAGMNGRWNSFISVRYTFDRVRSGDRVLPRRQLLFDLEASPSRVISGIVLSGSLGQEIDFANHRAGSGPTLNFKVTLRPTDHLELRLSEARRWLNVDTTQGPARLFNARADRARTTYTFSAHCFLRLIVQYVETRNDPRLFTDAVAPKSGSFSGSALFAYKLNWQTLLFAGYGDDREISDVGTLEPSARRYFLKVSYAFQR
jgi:hypothetical protein